MTESDDNLMSEIGTHETGLMFGPFEHLARMLLTAKAITTDGLYLIRNELKDGTWHYMPSSLEGRRLLLLADVCIALSDVDKSLLDYFRAVGDLPEAAPDDADGIA